MKKAGLSVIVLPVIKVICILSKTIPSPGRQTCASMEFFVGNVGNTSMLLLHVIRFYHCIALAQLGSSQSQQLSFNKSR